ncbi:MAG: AAA family ATPase [Pseudomonadota bacterium]|nr:AAA family ATPase [Pseudomonadota bacterium]
MPEFADYLHAAYPCLWVNTLEPDRAQRTLAAVALEVKGVGPLSWDIAQGFTLLSDSSHKDCKSPAAAVTQAAGLPNNTTVFLWNFHRLLSSLEVVQAVQNALPDLKAKGNCLVVLAPSADKIPEELARVFTTLEFAMPDRAALRATMAEVAAPYNLTVPPEDDGALVDAALGLTDMEAEDAFALSLVTKHGFNRDLISQEKAGALLRQSQLQINRFQERFSDLGGLDVLKDYTLKTAVSPMSLGVLILGIPGGGKSHFCKALANELSIPCLSLDFSRMMASLVGASEANMRNALKAVDAMGRVVVMCDEVEKGLAGARSSGETDSGTKAGVASVFLRWLSDREPGRAYVVATCNRIDLLPPEYQRAERWDALFYIDLPNAEEKTAIWRIHEAKYKVEGEHPDDSQWTGAEIKATCRTAAMMGCSLKEAAQYIVPIARSMKEDIDALRQWAGGRAIPASLPEKQPMRGRRIALRE